MKFNRVLSFAVLAAAASVAVAQIKSSDPLVASPSVAVVATEAGSVQGFVHRGIFTYRGIPYAQAARFMAPEKPASWEGVRTALTYGPICPQVQAQQYNDVAEFMMPHRIWVESDNCQNLNVWTPGINDGSKRPVMVWFHGGGFTNGSAIEQVVYDGESLARKGDVVVVTVNHRLNVLGFLDLAAYGPQYKNSGNVGIMDLVASLEWVKANIARFGGDPANVTIFGQSGGGGKVATLMSLPSAKGLFHKAVIESGGVFLQDPKAARHVAELTLKNLHLDPSQVDQLQKIPYKELNEAGDKALMEAGKESGHQGLMGRATLSWSPVADGEYLPMQSSDRALTALNKDVPLMVGSTQNEFAAFAALMDPRMKDSASWSEAQAKDYLRKQYGDKTDAVVAALKKAYPKMKPGAWIAVDTLFRSGVLSIADGKADQHGAPVYVYLFSWVSPIMDGMGMAPHCAEIPFVFNNVALDEQGTGGGSQAYAMAARTSQAWINFARSGNPGNQGLPPWPAYTRQNGATMVIDRLSHVVNNHDKELIELTKPNLAF
jgi:para-nitrobenzyl esterase